MRSLFILLPVLLAAQTTPSTTPAPAPKAATKAPAKAPAKAATTQSAAPKPAGTPGAAPVKPAGTASTGTGGRAGRGARGAVTPRPAIPVVPPLNTEEEKTVYSLGLSMYRSLAPFNLTPGEIELVKRALSDAAANKPAVQFEEYGGKIQGLMGSRAAKAAEKEKASASAYLAKAAAEPGAVKTDSGLIYKEVRPGTGPSPQATDKVKVNYRGTLIDGTEFDSSYKRNEPIEFPLNGVIPCWTEGVQKMKVGGKSILVCPSSLAYGDQGRRPVIPGGAALVFEVELLDIPGAK